MQFSPKDTHRAGRLPDLVCFSHLRWNFVFQRPQHLLSRFAMERRVFFFEEPVFDGGKPRLELAPSREGVWVATPHLPEGLSAEALSRAQEFMLEGLLEQEQIHEPVLWYYTPMALPFSRHLRAAAVVYDCMDELSAFKNAPPSLLRLETELLQRADVVFTGGVSLYEAKRHRHANIHACPSSVDVAHFARARRAIAEPADQAPIPHPRVGFFGVVDERMDLALLEGMARLRPDWHFVIVGPVVKISPESLPRLGNLHYLGGKSYDELPAYLSGWDAAMMPFARNESTRFISPTKTPEFLAAGRPVVSTSIQDVVHPYGRGGLVRIADEPEEFVEALEESMAMVHPEWLAQVDAFLATSSWDKTWSRMKAYVDRAAAAAPELSAQVAN